MPMMLSIFPVLTLLKPSYCSGLSLYWAMALFANMSPITPKILPKIEQQQAKTIERIPNTKTAVLLGNFCLSISLNLVYNWLIINYFIKIRNNHSKSCNDYRCNDYFVIRTRFVNKIKHDKNKKQHQRINGGIHIKSICKFPFKNKSNRALNTATHAVYPKEFPVHTRQHIFFHSEKKIVMQF